MKRPKFPVHNENRERLFQVIHDRPGLGVRDAGRRCGLQQGSTAYHVEYLEREGRVSTARFQGRRLLFAYKAPTGRALAEAVVLEDPAMFSLHEWVRLNGPVAQRGILNHFPEPRSTIQNRLDRLSRAGLLQSAPMGRERLYGVPE